jgi:hypothetical protein
VKNGSYQLACLSDTPFGKAHYLQRLLQSFEHGGVCHLLDRVASTVGEISVHCSFAEMEVLTFLRGSTDEKVVEDAEVALAGRPIPLTEK